MEAEKWSSVPSVAVSDCTRMEFDTRVSEKCGAIFVETAIVDFHAENALAPANPPFFLL
jgi:hypothetical protein